MQNRKETAWKKNREWGQLFGGRTRRRWTDNIVARLHTLQAPGEGAVLPIVMHDNPSSELYFPIEAHEYVAVLRALPPAATAGITHIVLRRGAPLDRRARQPWCNYIQGRGVHALFVLPWTKARREYLPNGRPTGAFATELARFGGQFQRRGSKWFVQFSRDDLRAFALHCFLCIVAHHAAHMSGTAQFSSTKANRRREGDRSIEFANEHFAAAERALALAADPDG